MQQAYATALWYLSCIMSVSHADQNSSEAIPGNDSSATTASFGKSKHARSLETAKDCSATVSNDSASDSVIAERSESDSKIAEHNKNNVSGSVITQRSASDSEFANFNENGAANAFIGISCDKHARSSKTAKDSLVTVSGKTADESCTTTAFIGISGGNFASGSGTANRHSAVRVNQAT